jgi:polyisoprenoid-binding protein YceI
MRKRFVWRMMKRMTRLYSYLTVLVVATLGLNSLPSAAATYTVDLTHTFAWFEISHFGTSTIRGRFDRKEGSIELDRAAKTGKIDMTIDTTSISTGLTTFDRIMRSSALFDTDTYPTAKFVSDKLVFEGDSITEVSGNFTLLGKTLPLTLKAINFSCRAAALTKQEICGGDFEATFDRSTYGMNYAVAFGMTKTVKLVIQVEAAKQ